MRETIPMKNRRDDDYVITMDGYNKENYKWDPVQKKVVYIKKGKGSTSGEKTANKKKDDVTKKLLEKSRKETEKSWENLNKEEFTYHFDKFRSNVEGKMIQLREDVENKAPKNLIKEDIEQVNWNLKDMNRFKEKLGNINQKLHTKSHIDKVQKEMDELLKKYNK